MRSLCTSCSAMRARTTNWKSLTRCHGRISPPSKRRSRCSMGHLARRMSSGAPPFVSSASCTRTSGVDCDAASSRRQFLLAKYWGLPRNTSTAVLAAMCDSRASTLSRSSTSRNARIVGTSSCSWRLIVCTASWLAQLCERKRCQCFPTSSVSVGGCLVDRTRRTRRASSSSARKKAEAVKRTTSVKVKRTARRMPELTGVPSACVCRPSVPRKTATSESEAT
mmetsp:Transcript_30557/g.79336  ORF Transcript_30557/g.79336 Transcript_30557/m.79336 type:complete len:223 (+) Transcript_30557:103-771(+)